MPPLPFAMNGRQRQLVRLDLREAHTALGSQAEKSKNKQKPPLASKTIKDMQVKSGILGGVLG